MYLIIDCETNGKPLNYQAPVEDLDNWPRVVQLAWILFSEDGELQYSRCELIRPEGWQIPAEVVAVHGITHEQASTHGISILDALEEFEKTAVAWAKGIVAHNLGFDLPVVGAEFLGAGLGNPLASLKGHCTMQAGTDICRLPGRYGLKWPRLGELHQHLFGASPEQLHDALADARSCAKCFFEMRRRGILKSA